MISYGYLRCATSCLITLVLLAASHFSSILIPTQAFLVTPSRTLRQRNPSFSTIQFHRKDDVMNRTVRHLSNKNRDDSNQSKVQVNIIPDVDPITLTAIGFALIACNFLIFANLGDGGIGSFVARMINTFN